MTRFKYLQFYCGILILLLRFLIFTSPVESQVFRVVAVGDSHVEPRSAFIRSLQNSLGDSYLVEGHGRRGWTSSRWIRAGGAFRREVSSADIVLISLGGNDISVGISPERTKENINFLMTQVSSTTLFVYHMGVPRIVLERHYLGRDGTHMTLAGSRAYSEQIAAFLFYP